MDKEKQGAIAIGARIRAMRKDAKLTQQAFAKAVGVSLPTVNRVEKGHRFPDSELLIAIKQKFDADLNWLLTGEAITKTSTVNSGEKLETLIPLFRRLTQRLGDGPPEDITDFLALPDFPPDSVACQCADDGCAPLAASANLVLFTLGHCDVGALVVVCDEWGRGFVRRKQILEGKVQYVPDHSGYALLTDSEVTCLGKVCGVVKRT